MKSRSSWGLLARRRVRVSNGHPYVIAWISGVRDFGPALRALKSHWSMAATAMGRAP